MPTTTVVLDGTVTYTVNLPEGLTQAETSAAEQLAKVFAAPAAFGYKMADMLSVPASRESVRQMANSVGITAARLSEIADALEIHNMNVHGSIRGLPGRTMDANTRRGDE